MTTYQVKISDVIVGAFILLIASMLLVPLPTILLDFLLVINIAFSFLLLLAGLYMPNALALLSFPSLLLLTTLFRLGLDVASTRLILTQGDAGQVIQAFGTFLIRGEIAVGIVIFIIITVVNFIVIARGASRVSEVAARFALDALPGKQMAIDADLRSGLISAEVAQRRREDLRKESQLYGSMDGAMKFVQGDAIAGIFIIFTNIVGGLYMGISAGMEFGEAIQTYTLLTIGDGLVHQLPAILISICAGIVVTRVSSSEHTSLGSDVQAQVFRRPGAILFTGFLMIVFGLTPGLPALPFITVGVGLVMLVVLQRKTSGGKTQNALLPILREPERLTLEVSSSRKQLTKICEVVVEVDAGYLYKRYGTHAKDFEYWWQALCDDFEGERGVLLPKLRFEPNQLFPRGHFELRKGAGYLLQGDVVPNALLVEVNPENAHLLGFDVLKEEEHPIRGAKVFWTMSQGVIEQVVQMGDMRVLDNFQYIGLKIVSYYDKFPEEVFTASEVLRFESELEEAYPELLNTVINREIVSLPRLTHVLQELLRQGIGVKDFKQIIEYIGAYCATKGASLVSQGEFDIEEVVSFIRIAQKKQILGRAISPRGTLKVVSLAPEVEEIFEDSPSDVNTGIPGFSQTVNQQLKKGLVQVIEPVLMRGIFPIVLLCRGDLRERIQKLMRVVEPRLTVLAFDELVPEITVEPVGVWGV